MSRGEKNRIQDRRHSVRVEMFSKAFCTRFDDKGRTVQQALLRCVDISSGGARFTSDFLVAPGQVLEFTMPLGPDIILFSGRVSHVTPFGNQSFEFGMHIERIEAEDRIALAKFIIRKCRERTFENRILRAGQRVDFESRNLIETLPADSFRNL